MGGGAGVGVHGRVALYLCNNKRGREGEKEKEKEKKKPVHRSSAKKKKKKRRQKKEAKKKKKKASSPEAPDHGHAQILFASIDRIASAGRRRKTPLASVSNARRGN